MLVPAGPERTCDLGALNQRQAQDGYGSNQLDQLTPDDHAALIHILDHMLANNRARAALTGHAS